MRHVIQYRRHERHYSSLAQMLDASGLHFARFRFVVFVFISRFAVWQRRDIPSVDVRDHRAVDSDFDCEHWSFRLLMPNHALEAKRRAHLGWQSDARVRRLPQLGR